MTLRLQVIAIHTAKLCQWVPTHHCLHFFFKYTHTILHTQCLDSIKAVLEVLPMLLDAPKLKEVTGGEGAETLAVDTSQPIRVDAIQVELSHSPLHPAHHLLLSPLRRVCNKRCQRKGIKYCIQKSNGKYDKTISSTRMFSPCYLELCAHVLNY